MPLKLRLLDGKQKLGMGGGKQSILGFSYIGNICWVVFFTFPHFKLLLLLMAMDSSGHSPKLADVDILWIDEKEQGGRQQGSCSRQKSCYKQRQRDACGSYCSAEDGFFFF